MKTYTPTELRNDSGSVYNEVMMRGQAMISGKSRPDMILMTKERFNQILKEAHEIGAYEEYKAMKAMESK